MRLVEGNVHDLDVSSLERSTALDRLGDVEEDLRIRRVRMVSDDLDVETSARRDIVWGNGGIEQCRLACRDRISVRHRKRDFLAG